MSSSPLRIGVFFGGRSTEHDVSIASAFAVMRHLVRAGYAVSPIYVTREGTWVYDTRYLELETFVTGGSLPQSDRAIVLSTSGADHLQCVSPATGIFGRGQELSFDVVFPVFHGLGGEDGSVQGLCEFLGVPYVGPSIFCNALGINKIAMKRYFEGMGLPVTCWRSYHRSERAAMDMQTIAQDFTFPVFVKPARLGSTIGISMVKSSEQLGDAVDVAFYYDTDIVIEEAVPNVKELLQSVMEHNGEVRTSLIESPITKAEFLTFTEKYTSSEGGTMAGLEKRVECPANISSERAEEVSAMSRRIFREFFAGGGAPRIDYLYDTVADRIFVNEINTIPGALQMHLWEKTGISQGDFLKSLIETAVARHREMRERRIDYQSNILAHTLQFIRK